MNALYTTTYNGITATVIQLSDGRYQVSPLGMRNVNEYYQTLDRAKEEADTMVIDFAEARRQIAEARPLGD